MFQVLKRTISSRLSFEYAQHNKMIFNYSKTCEKRPLKIDKIKILMTNGSFTKVESNAALEHSAMLLTYIKLMIKR